VLLLSLTSSFLTRVGGVHIDDDQYGDSGDDVLYGGAGGNVLRNAVVVVVLA
jgi:hypothetical protein